MRGQILGATGASDRALLYKSYPGKSSLPQKLGHTGVWMFGFLPGPPVRLYPV